VWCLVVTSFACGGEADEGSGDEVDHDDPETGYAEAEGHDRAAGAGVAPRLDVQQGRSFEFVVPEGWRVSEEGQFAVVLVAPDQRAMTIVTGNSGLPPGYPPVQFLQERLAHLVPHGLRFGPMTMAQPIAGCSVAFEAELTYHYQEPCRGKAKVSIAPSYDSATMVMTFAASTSAQWDGYSPWLPRVPELASARDGSAFGMSGVMAQNLSNSIELGRRAAANREWSARNWAATTRARSESQQRNQEQFREALGGVTTYTNPSGATDLELPNTFQNYWIDEAGQVVGTNDPGENPNVGSTRTWTRLEPRRR
jgi:hypothetical protein